jgi:hypothetical protein
MENGCSSEGLAPGYEQYSFYGLRDAAQSLFGKVEIGDSLDDDELLDRARLLAALGHHEAEEGQPATLADCGLAEERVHGAETAFRVAFAQSADPNLWPEYLKAVRAVGAAPDQRKLLEELREEASNQTLGAADPVVNHNKVTKINEILETLPEPGNGEAPR